MKTITLLTLLLLTQPVFSIGIYKWEDQDGKEIYGNNPPENSNSNKLVLPEITIIESKEKYQDELANSDFSQEASQQKPIVEQQEQTQKKVTVEEKFEVTYPQDDEVIRANDGNITAKFNLQPKLKKGQLLVVYLDGKQLTDSTQLDIKLEALDRGTHSLFAVKRDADGSIVANSNNVKFHILRHSALFNQN